MRKLTNALCLGSTIIAFASAAAAQEGEMAEAFQPDGKWRLNTFADGCSVARDFTRGEERVTLSIKRIHPRSRVQYAVIGAPIMRGSGSLTAGFVPGKSLSEFRRVAAASIGDREGFVFAGALLPRTQDDTRRVLPEEVTDFIVIDPRGVKTTLHTRAIDKAVSALDACVEKKLETFGVDPQAHRKLSQHATPKDMAEWAPEIQRNYPREALRNGRGGEVLLRLIIDDTGRVTHCHSADFLTAEVLRDAACESMLEHARYNPARDADGNATTDYSFQSIRYSINFKQRHFTADAHGFALPDDEGSGDE